MKWTLVCLTQIAIESLIKKYLTLFAISEFVNPKAVSLKHLFGEFDPVNMEWSDGVISSIFRRFADANSNRTFKWIVFDGPISTEWIENLNTALDDNRKLCLSSGEVLNLTQNTLTLFEVGDLSHASPSTVKSNLKIVNDDTSCVIYCLFRFHASVWFTSNQTHCTGAQ